MKRTVLISLLIGMSFSCATTGLTVRWGEGGISRVDLNDEVTRGAALDGKLDKRSLSCRMLAAGGDSFGTTSFSDASYQLRICLRTQDLVTARDAGKDSKLEARIELFGREAFGDTVQTLLSPCSPEGMKRHAVHPTEIGTPKIEVRRDGEGLVLLFAEELSVVVDVQQTDGTQMGAFLEKRHLAGELVWKEFPVPTHRGGLACRELQPGAKG